jgi:hypothetical protein
MTIAMWWIVVGVLMIVAGVTWLFGPFGLATGGVACVGCGLFLAPDRGDSS